MQRLKERAEKCRKLRLDHRIAEDWLQTPPVAERRLTPRTRLKLAAELRPRGLRRYGVAVEELSSRGCRVAAPGDLAPGSYAWIMLPTLESWYARIAWCRSGAAGLDFAQPLHEAVTRLVVERAAAERPAQTR